MWRSDVLVWFRFEIGMPAIVDWDYIADMVNLKLDLVYVKSYCNGEKALR